MKKWYGLNTAISILMVLGILVVIMLFSHSHHKRYDMTENKKYTLSKQSVDLLKNLDRNVTAIVFYTKGSNFLEEAKTLLEQYKYYNSKHFKILPLNTDKNPAEARQFNLTRRNSIVLKCGEKREVVNRIEEEAITNALIKVIEKGKKTVYFVTGHNERKINDRERQGYLLAKNALEKEAYQVKEINLAREEIPKDCDVLVIAGPVTDFFPEEVKRVKEYVKKGGSVLFLFEAWRDNTYLRKYLEEIGIKVNDDLILDPISKKLLGEYFWPMATSYGHHPIVKDFNLMTFYPLCRSLVILQKGEKRSPWVSLAMSSPASWGETDKPHRGAELKFDAGKDLRGPLTMAAAVTLTNEENPQKKDDKAKDKKDEKRAKIVVFGNVEFASNYFFNQQGNRNIFLNSISWLAERENLISIRPKSHKFYPLFLKAVDKQKICLFTVVILPGVVLMLWLAMIINRK